MSDASPSMAEFVVAGRLSKIPTETLKYTYGLDRDQYDRYRRFGTDDPWGTIYEAIRRSWGKCLPDVPEAP